MNIHLYKNTYNEYHQHNNYHSYRAAGHVRLRKKVATENSISVRNIFFIDIKL